MVNSPDSKPVAWMYSERNGKPWATTSQPSSFARNELSENEVSVTPLYASPPANPPEGWVMAPMVSAALEDVVILCDYAYKVGYHELGYDPVEVLRGAVQKIPQEATEAMIDAAFDATIWPYMTRPTSTEVIAALRENMRKEYRAMISAAPPVSAK